MHTPEFWQSDGLPSQLLLPAAWAYRAAAAMRRKVARTRPSPVPVICIGNLVAGGAGKTPVALALGARLAARGHAVQFLSRGYGGREKGPVLVDPERHGANDVGDEPLLLARVAPTWISTDRPAGAASAKNAGAALLVMDDGHQNATISKAFSIVVVDGSYGFGNGRLLPSGPLREPVKAGLARADAVIVIGPDETGVVGALPDEIGSLHGEFVPLAEDTAIAGKPVVAFAGIARPEKFFETLSALGCRIERKRAFPDHHRFREAEIADLIETAKRTGAVPVTTAKDGVRLPRAVRDAVKILHIAFRWKDEAAAGLLFSAIEERTGVAR